MGLADLPDGETMMQTEAQTPEATPENLAHFAANPHALANLTEDQIESLANSPKTEGAPADKEKGDTNGSNTPVAASQPQESEDGQKVVLGKDGKTAIPYSVLERERERAARAEVAAEALADQIKKIQEGKAMEGAESAQLSNEELEQLDQDLPGVAKAIRAQMAMLEKLTGTVQTLKRGHESAEQTAEQVRKDEEEAAIAASETLTALRSGVESGDQKSTARWNRIVDTYSSMRDDPEFDALDTAALIGKAQAAVEAIYGPMSTNPAASPVKQTAAAIDAKAAAALEAAAKHSVPLSSGGIPGGSAPPVDEVAAMLEKSGAQLTDEFMRMTPEQIEAKLNKLR